MKKIVASIGFIFGFFGCSDGDVEVQNISFAQITATSTCNSNYFKINGNEMLLLRIAELNAIPFPNEITAPLTPRVYNINASNQVIYRNYSATPMVANICNAIPPAAPSVIEEWTAIGGTIEITTTPAKTAPNSNNETRITGYNHYVLFKNIVFQKPSGTQRYNEFPFGFYFTPTTLNFPVANRSYTSCSGNGNPVSTIYNQEAAEGVVITGIDATLFPNITTAIPGTRTMTATANVLTIKTFNGNIPMNYFCGIAPATPAIINTWVVDYTVGTPTIEVKTTNVLGTYSHEVRLKNVTIKKSGTNSVSFYLGDDFILGTVTR